MTSTLRFFECITGSLLLIILMAINPQISTRAQMGGGGMGNGMGAIMLVSGGTPYRHDGATIKMEDAITIATGLLNAIGDSSLALDEVEEWEFNYYIVVKQAAPSKYKAFQLIMDKWTGAVMPEPGPGMIWNQKYGGMMGSMSDRM